MPSLHGNLFTGGFGWLNPGNFVTLTIVDVDDDFESYSNGSITLLTLDEIYWVADGQFVT